MKTILLLAMSCLPFAGMATEPDTVVSVLHCSQITLAKSSYHARVDLYSAGPANKFFGSNLYFNVESKPRIEFKECKGESEKNLTCVDATKKKFFRTFRKGSNNQFTVALVEDTTDGGNKSLSFICE